MSDAARARLRDPHATIDAARAYAMHLDAIDAGNANAAAAAIAVTLPGDTFLESLDWELEQAQERAHQDYPYEMICELGTSYPSEWLERKILRRQCECAVEWHDDMLSRMTAALATPNPTADELRDASGRIERACDALAQVSAALDGPFPLDLDDGALAGTETLADDLGKRLRAARYRLDVAIARVERQEAA